MGEPKIGRRKAEHLTVTASGEADFRAVTSLLEEVTLVHQALPELDADAVDLSTTLAGLKLRAPIVVAAMTGGTPEAEALNHDLARAAAEQGLAFGLGSQRAMAEHPELASTFTVRDAAPDVLLFGNVGVVQARAMGVKKVKELAKAVGADAMCVHLNPAMELVQDGGDRDFRGGLDTIRAIVGELGLPVIAKETGCGISRQAARALNAAGVRTVDVSGAGGTSWVAVEQRRATPGTLQAGLGEELWDWGIPTAASVAACRAEGLEVIATGGVRSGLDVARAIALGASAGGFAAPLLRAHRAGGLDGVRKALELVIAGVRAATLLTGCAGVRELTGVPRVFGPTLRAWLRTLAPEALEER